MTLRDLKKLNRIRAFRAVVRNEGHDSYLVELSSERGAGLLRNRIGKPVLFRSLSDVHRAMRACGVSNVELDNRLAA